MHKCPVCKNYMSNRSEKKTILRYTRYCPYCGTLLRKKKSIWMLPLYLGFAICGANFKTHWIFAVMAIIIGIVIYVAFSKLPYVPYNE
ncbi:MAG: hypothetical protein IJN03_03140 [Bacilli bacterium]|nr:hypothetical protein [Bacilli bacterium]